MYWLFLQAARQKVLALRKQKEAEAVEFERKRKEAAAAKLKELEERIARKQAVERCDTEAPKQRILPALTSF